MAKFYVGQRVRAINSNQRLLTRIINKEGAIQSGPEPMRDGDIGWRVLIFGEAPSFDGPHFHIRECNLAPLTDPTADRFIESIKKLGREPINDVKSTGIKVKVTVTK